MFMDNLTDFFKSTVGIVSVIILLILMVALFMFNLKKDKSLSVKTLTYSAIAMALAIVLSNIKLLTMPYGGTVSACSMMFITFIGYWFGIFPGVIAAMSYGLLQLIIDPYVVHPMQLLLDYPIAFGMLGISGLFSDSRHGLYKGYFVACLCRWICSTLSGILFFSEYAKDLHPIVYSAVYNISHIGGEMIISGIILSMPAFKRSIDYVKKMSSIQ